MILQEASVYATLAPHDIGDMNMADKLGVDCPCGFTFATPHGQDDAVAVVQLHIDRVHKNDYPNGLSRADALKEIEKVE
jgi:hypothetical protein